MAQETLVVQVAPAKQRELRAKLNEGTFDWRRVPHATFSVKGEGIVATLYQSGKLVVQGADPQAFLARYVGGAVPGPARKKTTTKIDPATDTVARVDVVTVGSDEAGKGDYFGPLVVAAVRLEPEFASKMDEGGVMDSKRLTDSRALELGVALRSLVPFCVVRVDPAEYNKRYPTYPGLNTFLADLHAEAIRGVVQPGDRVLVDRFAAEVVMKRALRGLDIRLEQATKAERNPAVAAASVLARQEFLLGLAELSERFGVDLHKGAGRPTDDSGVRFVREHGMQALNEVAKLHFKNTEKVRARVG
ncbi:MAG: ribonuclease HIII [Planctomycetota bacterium]